LSSGPAKLHRLAESIPWILKSLKIRHPKKFNSLKKIPETQHFKSSLKKGTTVLRKLKNIGIQNEVSDFFYVIVKIHPITLFRKLVPAFKLPYDSKKFFRKLPVRNPEKLFRKPVITCKIDLWGRRKAATEIRTELEYLELVSVFNESSIFFLNFNKAA
jgi:hypothetical protein